MFRKFFSTIALVAVAAPLMATEWSTDMEAAKAQAIAENKALLLDFTGSDWCGCCIQLRKSVLDTPQFETYAQDKFVCVEVDMPRGKKQPDALAATNKALCERYEIQFFPTILVIAPEGDVLGGFIGGRYSVENIHEPLDVALANLAKLRTARAAEGVEQAKGLAEIARSLPQEFRNHVQTYRKEIETLDPEDICRFRALTEEEERAEFLRQIHAAGDNYKLVISLVDARLPHVSDKEKGEVLRIKGMALAYGAKTEADLIQAKATLLEAADNLGEGRAADSLRSYVAQQFADIPALLRQLEERRAEEAGTASELDSFISKLQDNGKNFQKSLEMIDEQLAQGKKEQRPALLRLKASLLVNMAKTEQDLLAAKAMFLEAADLMGDSKDARYIRQFVDKEFADLPALLEQVRKQNP